MRKPIGGRLRLNQLKQLQYKYVYFKVYRKTYCSCDTL